MPDLTLTEILLIILISTTFVMGSAICDILTNILKELKKQNNTNDSHSI